MLRNILSIIVGYAIFVASSLALFNISGQKSHAEATIGFQVLTAVYGTVFSILAGFVVQLIASAKKLRLNYILAAIIAAFAMFSMIKADGSHWTQLLAIVVFAPISVLGGVLYQRKIK